MVLLRLRSEFNGAVAALFFGGVHSAVCPALDGVNAAPVFGVAGESDTDAGLDLFAFVFQRRIGDGLNDPLRNFDGPV